MTKRVCAMAVGVFCSTISYGAVFNENTAAGFQAALDAAETNGEADTINLAAVAFLTSANGNATFAASVTDGFDLTIAGAGVGSTFIDGDAARQALSLDATLGTTNLTVRDLTLRNCGVAAAGSVFGGCADVNSGGGSGAGALRFERLAITSSTITSSGGSVFGGGLNAQTDGDLTLDAVTFSSLTVTAAGGSLFGGAADLSGQTVRLTNVSADAITSTSGTGSTFGSVLDVGTADDGATVTIEGLGVTGCDGSANGDGSFFGAVDVSSGDDDVDIILRDVSITGCTVSQAGDDGSIFGAMLDVGGGANSTVLVERAYLVDNEVTEAGGGSIFGAAASLDGATATIVNSAIGNNRATEADDGSIFGVGLDVSGDLTRVLHNTIWDNRGTEGGDGSAQGGGLGSGAGGITIDIYNNIVWGNLSNGAPDDVFLGGGSNTYNYFDNDVASFTQSGGGVTLNQGGNIDVDPLLVGFATGDFHLAAGSPVIDQGNAVLPLAVSDDFDGDSRPIGLLPDMGADEHLASVLEVPSLGPLGLAALAGSLLVLAARRLRARRR